MASEEKWSKTAEVDPIWRRCFEIASAGSKMHLFQKLSSPSESPSRAASIGHKSGGVKPIENSRKTRSQSGTFGEIRFIAGESNFDLHMN